MNNWPLVHERDDGIRPAGEPDQCFYCQKKVGEAHARDCVIVKKRVLLRVRSIDGTLTGTWERNEPHSFQPDTIEYMLNDSTWCASNIISNYNIVWNRPDAQERLKAMTQDGHCLCSKFQFEFVRVVDDTPRRRVNE